ncbi:MAG: PASTA domain-containing protein [Actinobacteria bacterium]|nr:PASTA domain-containing protein [Actinomycetota bacterium]
MEISFHQAERIDRRGRRLIAAAVLAAIAVIASSWVGLLAFLSGNAVAGTLVDLRRAWIPNVSSLSLALPDLGRLSEVYTADGVRLGLLTERNSQPLPMAQIPDLVVAAVLSAEDAGFWTHPGIDHRAIARALLGNVGGGTASQGGSTITQQVVKQNFIGTEPTLRRKVSEAAIAMELERRYTKEQILEFYLNSVYFGANAYGVQAAAQEYFGKALEELTIAEAAALAVPIRNPTLYNLRNRADDPTDARDRVIGQMQKQGYITEEEAEEALRQRLVTVPHQEFQTLAPQVLIAAKEAVLNDPRFGLGDSYLQRKRALFGCPADDTTCEGGGGLKVYVTVDYGLQEQAQELLQRWFPPGFTGPTGAIAMVDNRTGATIVMASGLEFGEDVAAGQRTYDIATKGRRNPGSAFKPFGVVAAMENGYPLKSYWAESSPQILEYGAARPWVCYGGPRDGTIRTLEQATIASTNSVFCGLAVKVGAAKIAEVAHRMGIRSPLGDVPAIVLGASAVSPLEMAAGYSTLANYGLRVESYLIERIEDAAGNIVYRHQPQRTRVLDAALAAAVVNTLEQAVSRGTGGNAWIGRPQAGKTGTHEGHTDVWFVGFIPQYTTSVWVGFPDSQVEMRNIVINGTYYDRVWGSSVAAPIWADFMEMVTADLPVLDFAPDPPGIEAYYETPREEVPDVIGMELEEALEELYAAGFEVEWEYVNSDEPKDDVVAQNPEHPTRHKQGLVVEIEVSSGRSPEVAMPNLLDMDLGQALSLLEALRRDSEIDFTWELVSLATGKPEMHNVVVGTRPNAGGKITKDTVVVIRYRVYEGGG